MTVLLNTVWGPFQKFHCTHAHVCSWVCTTHTLSFSPPHANIATTTPLPHTHSDAALCCGDCLPSRFLSQWVWWTLVPAHQPLPSGILVHAVQCCHSDRDSSNGCGQQNVLAILLTILQCSPMKLNTAFCSTYNYTALIFNYDHSISHHSLIERNYSLCFKIDSWELYSCQPCVNSIPPTLFKRLYVCTEEPFFRWALPRLHTYYQNTEHIIILLIG